MTSIARKIIIAGMLCWVAASVCSAQSTPAAAEKLSLPPMNASIDPAVYPREALKNQVQGRVLLEFSITHRNHVDDVTVLDSEPQGIFDSAARKALDAVKFKVPKNWEDSGAEQHRFTLSFVFRIYPCPTTPCVEPDPHEKADDFLIITANTNQ